eukprot:15215638-Heterocapsa_arctica.AAC.1
MNRGSSPDARKGECNPGVNGWCTVGGASSSAGWKASGPTEQRQAEGRFEALREAEDLEVAVDAAADTGFLLAQELTEGAQRLQVLQAAKSGDMIRLRQRQAQEVFMTESRTAVEVVARMGETGTTKDRWMFSKGKRGLAGGSAGRTRSLDPDSGPDFPDPHGAGGEGVRGAAAASPGRLVHATSRG